MTRRKRPPEGRTFAVATFRDPGSWLTGFLNYLDAECGKAKNTVDAYHRDLDRFFTWNRNNAKAGIHDVGVPVINQNNRPNSATNLTHVPSSISSRSKSGGRSAGVAPCLLPLTQRAVQSSSSVYTAVVIRRKPLSLHLWPS